MAMAPQNIGKKDPPYFLSPPKLWVIDDSINNYVVWRAMVHDQFKRDNLLPFIDGTVNVPLLENEEEYRRWIVESEKAKEKLLSLIDVALTDVQLKCSCREIWDALEDKFHTSVTPKAGNIPPSGSDPLQANLVISTGRGLLKPKIQRTFTIINTVTSSEYMKLHRAALLGDERAAKHIFKSDVVSMIKKNVTAISLVDQLAAENQSESDKEDNAVDAAEYTSPIYARQKVLDKLIYGYESGERTVYVDTARLRLLISAIDAEHFDSASKLLKKHPYLAELKLSNKSALTSLASKKSLFGGRPWSLDRLRSRIDEDEKDNDEKDKETPKEEPTPSLPEDTEIKGTDRTVLCMDEDTMLFFIPGWPILTMVLHCIIYPFCCLLGCACWAACSPLAITCGIGWLQMKLLKTLGFMEKPEEVKFNKNAFSLVRKLCQQMKQMNGQVEEIFGDAIILAARSGVHVVVEEIVHHSPGAALCWDPISSQYIFHMAIESRDHHLFRIIYEKLLVKNDLHLSLDIPDIDGNNILHLAGKSSPPDVLAKIPGSVLEIQHELKWYKGIEKLMSPRAREKRNRKKKTPKMIFFEEHKDLKDKAEKWMKDTANSCTIIAALISTIMFAAAITVPGGNDQNTGRPMFRKDSVFLLFAISDGISFVTSVTALLMFMEIMMSRYEVEDFMRHLPVRLFIGLGSLLISIMFMMLTFSVTVYLVFGQPRHWVLISVAILTFYIVILFALLQGSLLFELVNSTYRNNFIPDYGTSESHEDEVRITIRD